MKYSVKNIFGPTIEGEGAWAGKAVIFIRLAGCNMWNGKEESKAESICPYCDTDFYGGESMTASEIVSKVRMLAGVIKNVVISGGEPLLQIKDASDELLQELFSNYFMVNIETNGTMAFSYGEAKGKQLSAALQQLHFTCSPKQFPLKLAVVDCLKLLYPHPDPNLNPLNFTEILADKYLQPIMDADYLRNVSKTLKYIYEHPQWKLSLQIHKMIGVE